MCTVEKLWLFSILFSSPDNRLVWHSENIHQPVVLKLQSNGLLAATESILSFPFLLVNNPMEEHTVCEESLVHQQFLFSIIRPWYSSNDALFQKWCFCEYNFAGAAHMYNIASETSWQNFISIWRPQKTSKYAWLAFSCCTHTGGMKILYSEICLQREYVPKRSPHHSCAPVQWCSQYI